ncbi:S8 family serine peptidase [uncultured Dokdonia sp.]|uniref:S8 family serine peptidase n=1 Tax=uncultured Dokdonia sp. TaxID=575653 RepID=UPI00260E8623|nr:S8 family serine peptidase [uncultured Dokdonia sp.]
MKKLFFLAAFLFLCIISGCEKDDSLDELLENDLKNTTANFTLPINPIDIDKGEIVIKYEEGLSEAGKQEIRDQYQVTEYKKCECADPTLELWVFVIDSSGETSSGLTLETVVNGTRETLGVEGSQMNTIIKHKGGKLNSAFGPDDITSATNLLKSSNNGVTIAVLDTGIDHNYFGFELPFIYNNSLNTNACIDDDMIDYVGWNFVDNNNIPFDNHGHGTQASYMIYEKLTAQNINFQILPVKVFDENGNARYFDILCGFKYILNNSDVKIINMSFGWYGTEYTLLREFIESAQDDVLIIASAGNESNDNDIIAHYPSSYNSNNILSIASWNGNTYNSGLSKFSNYGTQSVDIAAPGQNIPFYIDENDYILLSGTSYASAYTSAIAGTLYTPGIAPMQHIESILYTCTLSNNLTDIKYQSYLDY